MTEEEFDAGVEVVKRSYPDTRVVASAGTMRAMRVSPVPIPEAFWCGGTTRLLVVFDLATHATARPRGLLGPEWRLPGGAPPFNASPVYECGESWQAFSWNFPWPPALSVLETAEAYLGRFNDHR